MTSHKARLTVTVDPALIEAGRASVSAGRAESLSAWVNTALAERVVKEERLEALADAIAAYEEEFGAIASEEIVEQVRADRASATIVRGTGGAGGNPRRKTG